MDPDLALGTPQTMQRRFDEGRQVITVVTAIVDMLTIAVLGLAALGLYGTLSFTFARRRRDIGVRLALGASPRGIALLVMRQAFVWVATGAAIGTAGSWLIARNLRAMLDDASPVDPMQLGVSVAVVLVTAALASSLPARRATRVSVVDVLRAE